MIRSLEEMIGYDLISTDGERFGEIKDFYFDSEKLITRYAVVDTGGWLTGRKVLISPDSFGKPNWEDKEFPVNLTKEEIENSPSIDKEKPVSRQMEVELAEYFNWPAYWAPVSGPQHLGGYTGVVPARAIPIDAAIEGTEDNDDKTEKEKIKEKKTDHLRSLREVEGYRIHALDGKIGHLETLMVNDENWVIQYMVVDTRNWLPGRKVLVAPEWLNRINYNLQELEVELHKDKIEHSPEYDPDIPITRDYEEDLYVYYGKERYW